METAIGNAHRRRRTRCRWLWCALTLWVLVAHAAPGIAEGGEPPLATLRGLVVDGKGEPVADLRVEAYLDSTRDRWGRLSETLFPDRYSPEATPTLDLPPRPRILHAVSDAEGRFSIPGVDSRRHCVVGIAPGQSLTHVGLVWARPSATVEIRCTAAKVHVFRVVADAPRTEPMWMRVRAPHPWGFTQWLAFGVDGTELTMPASQQEASLDLLIPGMARITHVPLRLAAGREHTIDLGDSGNAMAVRAVDPRGNLVPGALVDLHLHVPDPDATSPEARYGPRWHLRSRTDDQGLARFNVLPEGGIIRTMAVRADGFAPAQALDLAVPTASKRLPTYTLALGRPCSLDVVVAGEDAKPIAGARVEVWKYSPDRRAAALWRVLTDTEGHAQFEDLPEGPVFVRAKADGHFLAGRVESTAHGSAAPRVGYSLALDLVPGSQPCHVTLLRGNRLSGTLLTAEGKPWPHARLTLHASSGMRWYERVLLARGAWRMTTDAAGRFTLDGVPPRLELRPQVDASNHDLDPSTIRVAAFGSPTKVEVRVRARRTLEVRLRDPSSGALVPGSVTAETEDGVHIAMGSSTVDAPARLAVPTAKNVRLFSSFDPDREHTRVVRAGHEDVQVTIDLPDQLRSLHATVLDANGEPAPDVPLVLTPRDRQRATHVRHTRTDSTGRASFPRLPAVDLILSSPAWQDRVAISAEATEHVVRDPRPAKPPRTDPTPARAMRTLRARITLPGGEPLPRGRLRVEAVERGRRTRTTSTRIFGGHAELRTQLAVGAEARITVLEPMSATGTPLDVTRDSYVVPLPQGELTLRLRKGRSVECRVVDEQGEPLEGVDLVIFLAPRQRATGWRPAEALTNRQGVARFFQLPEEAGLFAAVRPTEGWHAPLPRTLEDGDSQLDFVLARGRTQRLQVVDANGVPQGDLEVQLRQHTPNTAPRVWGAKRKDRHWTARTDATGHVSFDDLHPDRACIVHVGASTDAPTPFARVDRDLGPPSARTRRVLRPRSVPVELRIQTPGGRPYAKCYVTIEPWYLEDGSTHRRFSLRVQSDDAGRIALPSLPEGDYAVRPTHKLAKARRMRVPREEPFVLVLNDPTKLEGRLHVPPGVRGATVRVYGRNERGEPAASGATLTPGAPGKPWTFQVSWSGPVTDVTVVARARNADGNDLAAVASLVEVQDRPLVFRPAHRLRVRYEGFPLSTDLQSVRVALSVGSYEVRVGARPDLPLPATTYSPKLRTPSDRIRGRIVLPDRYHPDNGELIIRYVPPDD